MSTKNPKLEITGQSYLASIRQKVFYVEYPVFAKKVAAIMGWTPKVWFNKLAGITKETNAEKVFLSILYKQYVENREKFFASSTDDYIS